MESYEALMENQMPPNSSNMVDYPGSFPQFPNNGSIPSSYSNLPGMSGSFSGPQSQGTGGGNLPIGAFSTPSSQSGYGNMSSATGSSSFSMPYDAPSMVGTSAMEMSAPPIVSPTTNKVIPSCNYCGLVLSSSNALIEHKRIHTGDRPFVCHVCNKRFTQKAHLNIHKRTHTGEKPYACHICHKRFAQSSHLTSHKRIHTDEKPYVCGICNVGFTQKQRLDAHLKKHLDQPGQELGRPPPLMTASGQLEQYRQGPANDDNAFMQMIGHGMPYVKQEPDLMVGDGNSVPMARSAGDVKRASPMGRSSGSMGPESLIKSQRSEDEGQGKSNNGGQKGEEGEEIEGEKSPSISAPSFSSEGMFLHPSGYVAYGAVEDGEQSSEQPAASEDAGTPSTATHPQSTLPASGGHRRKPTVVRKRYSESPAEEEDLSPAQTQDGSGSSVSEFQSFQPLQAKTPSNDSRDEEAEEGNADEFHDTGEVLDDKRDPPYQSSAGRTLGPGASSKAASSAVSQSQGNIMETRSHSRRSLYQSQPRLQHSSPMNGERINAPSGRSAGNLTFSGHTGTISSSGLVKVNNRVSLVNFTAEELVSHLMKRDDVHKCQFCCLIFQDAAMYHIHRNMHDKGDIRRCNMCGKLLQDKYDFTAHFLSMHQS
ncbi:ikaros family zinc finger protein [Aplysia californica]|uniref:Ikaros family zinc finger protein n=1 Tax=Aplysia californica TaxID=6500 RepID=A0ABM0K5U8_APLCA|nr:ikaros family zinc finger protein [Aplysia californica]